MEIYLDLLVLQNLIMNYLILWVTARYTKEITSFARLMLSALAGALYATIIFFPALKFAYTLLFKILISFLMIIIAFFPQKLRTFIKLCSVFYAVSFIFGGAAFGLFYFTNIGAVISNGVFYIENFPIKILIVSSAISYIVIKISWKTIQNRLSKENLFTSINIVFDNRDTKINALLDTANSLSDPVSNNPVIVVEFEALKNILPNEISSMFESSKDDDLKLVAYILSESKWVSRFRLIPFTSIGKPNGMLIGFKPDEVQVNDTGNIKILKNIIIGIYNKRLSKDESYSALLHPEILNQI